MNQRAIFFSFILSLFMAGFIPSASAQYAGDRSFEPPVYFPGATVEVCLDVCGVPGSVTVVETPPAGWTVKILGRGTWENGKITWNIPAFLAHQILRYEITPSMDATGDFLFSGAVNGQEISGTSILSPYTEPICTRTLPASVYFPQEPLRVQIQVVREPGPVTVKEVPPSGAQVTGINLGGKRENGVITWDLPAFTGMAMLTYTLTPPTDAVGDYTFSGSVGEMDITGQKTLVPYIEPSAGDHNGQTALTVAAVSMKVQADKEANLRVMEGYIAQAVEQDAHLIVFPEIVLQQNPGWGHSSYKPSTKELAYVRDTAEQVPGPGTDQMVGLARKYGIAIIFGMTEVSAEGKLYNTSVLLGPDGVWGKHRKVVVWGKTYGGNEDLFWETEPNIGVVDSPLGKIGLHICMEEYSGVDYCLPLVRIGGADLLVSVTIWSEINHIKANALNNRRWYILSDQAGTVGHLTDFGLGYSRIAHPSGRIMADTRGKEGMVVMRTDLWVDTPNLPEERGTKVEEWPLYW